MTRNKSRDGRAPRMSSITVIVGAMAAIAFAMPAAAQDQTSVSEIDVGFTLDGLGFEVASSKAISNVVVESCGGEQHKHEEEFTNSEIKVWNHTETQVVQYVYVKSGSDGENGTSPRFANLNAVCTEIPFFSTGTALLLGTVAALGGAFLVMRRRK